MATIPYLIPISILASLVGAAVVLAMGNRHARARNTALAFSLVPLVLSTVAMGAILFEPSFGAEAGASCEGLTGEGYHFYECFEWIPSLGINLVYGLDGISAPMFWLTSLLVTLAIVFAWDESRQPNKFYALLLGINVAVLGVFAALDLFMFYVFWEFSLIPMYLLISIWGGPNRKYAAIKFFIYTFLASLVMLLGFMALYFEAGVGSFAFEAIAARAGAFGVAFQKIVFIALFIGFAVKFPVVPVHTWLPDAHVQAPTAGSVILAGVLLKMGSYGLIRIALPFTPAGAQWAVPLMFVIAALSMIYAAAICLAQTDYKKLIAYSSIGSMGLVLLGIAASVQTGNPMGLVGALFMMLAHGFISPALFMLCGVLQHNLGTRDIPKMGGLGAKLPKTGVGMVVFSMAGLGLPGLAAFVAEFQIFTGTWQAFEFLILIPLVYLVLSAGYYLWAIQRAIMGPFEEKDGVDYGHVYDQHTFETFSLGVLFLFTLAYGVWPKLLTDIVDQPVQSLLTAFGGA